MLCYDDDICEINEENSTLLYSMFPYRLPKGALQMNHILRPTSMLIIPFSYCAPSHPYLLSPWHRGPLQDLALMFITRNSDLMKLTDDKRTLTEVPRIISNLLQSCGKQDMSRIVPIKDDLRPFCTSLFRFSEFGNGKWQNFKLL